MIASFVYPFSENGKNLNAEVQITSHGEHLVTINKGIEAVESIEEMITRINIVQVEDKRAKRDGNGNVIMKTDEAGQSTNEPELETFFTQKEVSEDVPLVKESKTYRFKKLDAFTMYGTQLHRKQVLDAIRCFVASSKDVQSFINQ